MTTSSVLLRPARSPLSDEVRSTLLDHVRRADPDRFFCSLFAPEPIRERLLLLYAFNNELARAREVASEPALALIRLTWWREVVEGAEKNTKSPRRSARR